MSFPVKPAMWCPGIRSGHPLGIGLEICLPIWSGGGNRLVDVSRLGRHGTFATGAWVPKWIASPLGPALDFDGGDVVIFGTEIAALDEPITLAAWLRWDGNAGYEVICATRDVAGYTWEFRIYEGHPNFLTDAGSQASALTLTSGQWCFVAVVVESDGNLTFWLDGESNTVGTKLITPGAEVFTVGDRASGSGGMDGAFAGQMVWSRALSVAEIEWLYREPWDLITHPTKVYLFYGALATGNRRRRVLICGRRRA